MARLAYAAFLAVALLGSGRFALNRVSAGWRAVLQQTPVERLLLCFYGGAGIAIPLLYAVDAAGLLYRWLVIPLFLAAVWLGYPAVADAFASPRVHPTGPSRPRTFALAALGVALAGIWVFILLNSTLAVVGFDHDSASHYLPYYQEVVANHGTRPNQYWYHFWVSKGAGLHFLSILLTDLEAPQLVSSVFLAFGALAMYAAVREASRSAAWALAAAAVLSAGFIGHFPYFQKDHIVSLGLVAGLLWAATSESLARDPRLRRMALTVLAIAAVVNAPPLAAVLVGFLALLSALEWWRLPRRTAAAAVAALVPAVAAGATILAILCLNFLWTGLAEITPFKVFLAFADQRRLAHYFSPYLLLWADEGSRGSTGELSLAALASRQYILHRLHGLLQLEALAPRILSLLAISVPALLVTLLWKPWRDAAGGRFFPAILLLAFAVALGFVVNQPGSLDRFYTFAFFPVILIGIGSLAVFFGVMSSRVQAGPRRALDTASLILALAIGCGSALYWSARWVKEEGFPLLRERAAFAAGRRTLEQAMLYTHWPRSGGGLPQRGLSAECVGLANALGHPGPGGAPRVWTMAFLYETGCYILPDVQLQLEFSVAFGNRWDRIVFGPPDAARAELRRIGVRYFYINLANFDIHRLRTQSSFVFGCLAYSPLFNPAMLRRRFRIVWRRDKALLLTFADNGGGEPISSALVSAWRKKVF
ncbi:MAG TPA: hypothetical protein VNF49_13080, partial [Candidatus Binataceae bacterium]|nr:hypothetical protein [Candidatus Binataceae bacterium]